MVSALTTTTAIGDRKPSEAVQSEWEYDAGGRLIRESTPAGPRVFAYDAAGQLLAITGPDGSRVEFVHDGLSRRTRLIGADGSWTEYAWGPTGHLTGTCERTPDGAEISRHGLWVDALGEFAGIDGTRLWWDTANPIPTLTNITLATTGGIAGGIAGGVEGHGGQVLSLPGGVTGIGDVWTAAGWRAARPTDETDPWAVLGTPTVLTPGGVPGAGTAGLGPGAGAGAAAGPVGGLPAGVGLTGHGGVDIAGLEWLGARAYDPGTWGFLSTDPLTPVLGAGWDGNPYAYAGNNPLNTTDPTGLRPLPYADLKAYDGSAGGAIAAAGDWWKDNWEYVAAGAAIVAGIALMCTGVGGPAGLALMMGAGALVSGGVFVATQKAASGTVDWGRVGVDSAVGALVGGLGAGTGALIAWKSGASLAGRAAGAAAGGGVEGGASGAAGYAMSPGPHTPGEWIQATGTGAAVGAATGGITGYQPKWLSVDTMSTFTGGIYRSGYSDGVTVLHRAGDTGFQKDFGGFWSADAPTSVAQVRNDKAILPEWHDKKTREIESYIPINRGYTAEFRERTPIYSGRVASQTGLDGTMYPGGTPQVHIPDSYKHGDIIND